MGNHKKLYVLLPIGVVFVTMCVIQMLTYFPTAETVDNFARTDIKECDDCFPRVDVDRSLPAVSCALTRDRISTTGPTLVVLITNEAKASAERNIIRATLGPFKWLDGARFEYKFVLGALSDNASRGYIIREMTAHQDIIVGNFLDTYRNLTLKTQFGIRWAVKHCPGADYIMKTDHDVSLNVRSLLHMVSTGTTPCVRGCCVGPMQPIRDSRHRWYTPESEYPYRFFPRYCSGSGYVIPMRVAEAIARRSRNVPMLAMEDVYTGVVLGKLGVCRQNVDGFIRSRTLVAVNPEYFCNCVITEHGYSAEQRLMVGTHAIEQRCVYRGSFYCLLLAIKLHYVIVLLSAISISATVYFAKKLIGGYFLSKFKKTIRHHGGV